MEKAMKLLVRIILFLVFVYQLSIAIKKLRKQIIGTDVTSTTDFKFYPTLSFFFYKRLPGNTIDEKSDAFKSVHQLFLNASFKSEEEGIHIDFLNQSTFLSNNWDIKEVWRNDFVASSGGINDIYQAINFNSPIELKAGENNKLTFEVNVRGTLAVSMVIHNRHMGIQSEISFLGSHFLTYVPSMIKNVKQHSQHSEYEINFKYLKTLNTEQQTCRKDLDPKAFSHGLQKFITEKIGCLPPVYNLPSQYLGYPKCDRKEHLMSFIRLKLKMAGTTMTQWPKFFGIDIPCDYLEFDTKTLFQFLYDTEEGNYTNNEVVWNIQLHSNTHKMLIEEQRISYEFSDFVADVGGYLGLLLGVSLLSCYDIILKFLNRLKEKYLKGKRTMQ